jgi:hypothetical protein
MQATIQQHSWNVHEQIGHDNLRIQHHQPRTREKKAKKDEKKQKKSGHGRQTHLRSCACNAWMQHPQRLLSDAVRTHVGEAPGPPEKTMSEGVAAIEKRLSRVCGWCRREGEDKCQCLAKNKAVVGGQRWIVKALVESQATTTTITTCTLRTTRSHPVVQVVVRVISPIPLTHWQLRRDLHPTIVGACVSAILTPCSCVPCQG